LSECHHTLAWSDLPRLGGLLPHKLISHLQKRSFPDLPPEKIHSHPWPELARLASRSLNIPFIGNALRRSFSIQKSNRAFDAAVARRLPHIPNLKGVYSYFDTSLHTFRSARKLGLRTIYELPTPYWRAVANICDSERRRLPAWAATLPSNETLSASAAQRDEELQLADLVIVPSHFVRESLKLAPHFKAPVIVLPYGCPEPGPPIRTPHSAIRTPLRLLFVGTLSQSKGLADLLEAIAPLDNQVHLTLAGSPSSSEVSALLQSEIRNPKPSGARQPEPSGDGRRQTASGCPKGWDGGSNQSEITLLGQLPHTELLAELPNHDLLVLPTLYEGLSLSILEAMSAGLPVLTTTHSGMKGLIENGRQILMVEPRSPEELRGAIQYLLQHPEDRERLSHEGLQWAKAHGWGEYRKSLRNVIETHLQESACSQGR